MNVLTDCKMKKKLIPVLFTLYIFSTLCFLGGCASNAQAPAPIKGPISIIGKWRIVATFLGYHFGGDFIWHPATSSYFIQYDSLGNFVSSNPLGLNSTCFPATFKKEDSIVITRYKCQANDSTIIEKLTSDSLILRTPVVEGSTKAKFVRVK